MNLELYWFSNFRDLLAYIKGDRRFYSFNIIDVVTHQVYIESQRSQEVPQIGGSLLRAWKVIGMPDFLQMDYALMFRAAIAILAPSACRRKRKYRNNLCMGVSSFATLLFLIYVLTNRPSCN